MSELSFGISGNDADFVEKATQMRRAINEVGAEFKALSIQTGNYTQKAKEFMDTLKTQIEEVVAALEKMNLENLSYVWNLQQATSQTENIQSEISVRKELTTEIQHQLDEMKKLKAVLPEYEENLKRTQEKQMASRSGLERMADGLSGVSGAISAITGTMKLFGVENKTLQTIMQKVHTSIEITNGLQAVSTALNKSSVLQLDMLGKAKLLWRSITMKAAAAQGIETVAASAGTVANLGLAGSFRAIGLAIKAVPVVGWIVTGISALMDIYSLWSSSTSRQTDKQEELTEGMKQFNDRVHNYAAKPVASIELLSYKFKALGDNIQAQKKFIRDNKDAFDELGFSISKVKDAQQVLIENKDKFIQAQIAKANSLAYEDFVKEEAKKFIDAKMAGDFWQQRVDAKQHKKLETTKDRKIANVEDLIGQKENSTLQGDNLGGQRPQVFEVLDRDQVKANHYKKAADESEAKMNYGIAQMIAANELSRELMPKQSKNNDMDRATRLENLYKKLDAIQDSHAREWQRRAIDWENKNCKAEIDAMEEGADKKLAQRLYNYDLELQELEREKVDYLKQKRKDAEEEFNAKEDTEIAKDPKHKRQTFNPAEVQLSQGEVAGFNNREENIIKKQNLEIQAYFDTEKQAMNEQLAAYGNFEQKRQAIIALGEAKKKGKSSGEQETIDRETNKTLSALEKEANKEKYAFGRSFSNMKNKSVEEMRRIAKDAQEAWNFVKEGEWNAKKGKEYGIGEATFNELHNSPEELKDIEDHIKEINDQANNCDTALNKMGAGFDKLFKSGSDPKKVTEALSLIESGLNEVLQVGKFLSGTLSNLGNAFGSEALGKAAEGINIAMDSASSAMSGAKAGAMFGPWGAAAGAAIGLVSSLGASLAKLHDAKHEKKIQEIQNQIDVLKKSYDNLGDSLGKAFSADASRLIEQQNTLLAQQKVLIQNQIAEEKSKKKSDKGKIKEWENQIDEIDKLIADNKEKQIDAILGSDVKAAIDDFAQAYADAWATGNDRAKSSKDLVKQMIKQMVMEAIKATTSGPMEALRQKLAEFFADGVISAWEREQIEKGAADLTKLLDDRYGWADDYLQDEEKASSQDSQRGGFETMSQETGTELNGRFSALQVSNEEIRNAMILALGDLSALCTTASDGNILLAEMRNLALMSNSHLEDIARYTKPILGFGEKLDKIERNTANL